MKSNHEFKNVYLYGNEYGINRLFDALENHFLTNSVLKENKTHLNNILNSRIKNNSMDTRFDMTNDTEVLIKKLRNYTENYWSSGCLERFI